MAGDVVWMDVLPSMQGFTQDLIKGSKQAAQEAGKKAGADWGKSFSGAAGDSGSNAVVTELEAAARKTKKVVEDQTYTIFRARASQRDSAAKLILAEQALADARKKHGGESAQAKAAEMRLEAARDRSRSAASKLETSEDSLRAAKREHRETTEQLETATKNLKDEADKQPTVWGKVSGAVSDAKGKFDDAAGGVDGLVLKLGAAVGATALLVDSFGLAVAGETGTAQMTAALDLTAEQSERAGAVAGELYSQAYGDSMGDVSSAVGSVMSSIEGLADAPSAAIEDATTSAMNLATTFGIDVAEGSAAAGTAIRNGLADDSVEAFDLITASLQQVPEAMRGDVLDAANEYGGVMADLGLSGEESFGMLVAASGDGSIAIDKIGDALKELTIRGTDMSAASVAAYEAIGLNAGDMANDILAGGDTAAAATQEIVDGLLGITDPAEQANAAIALFGTPLEDLGVSEIPTFLENLSAMDTGLGDVSGTAEEMDETLSNTAANGFEELKRSFSTMLSDGLEPLLGPAASFLTWVTDVPGLLPAVAGALGVLAAAWGIYTIQQWAANSAMLASPMTWVVLGIAALVAGVILAVTHWGEISDWLKEKWAPIGDWIQDKVFAPILTGLRWVGDKFTGAKDKTLGAWRSIRLGLKSGWDWIDDRVFSPIKGGARAVSSGFTTARDKTIGAWKSMRTSIRDGWLWINEKVFSPIKAGVDAVGDAFSATKDWITTSWDGVKRAAAAPVNFVIETVYTNGIKKTWDSIADAVGLDLRLPAVAPIRFADGGVMPGYTPGRDVHTFVSPTGGVLELSGGEPILRPEAGRVLGADWVHGVNAAARNGGTSGVEAFLGRRQAFAGGGFWDNVGGAISGAAGWVTDAASEVASFIANPASTLRRLITAPMEEVLSAIGGGKLGDLLVELPRKAVAGIVSTAQRLASGLTSGGETLARGLGSTLAKPTAGGWVRPSAGPVTSTYGPRWGAFHAGIDIAGGGKTYAARAGQVLRTGNAILPGHTGEGILIDHGDMETYYGHNPYGGIQVRPGQMVVAGQHVGYQGATGNVTGVHLHFGLRQNGQMVNPKKIGVFDSGGYLEPQATAVNLSSRPEPVLTGQQWADIHTLASRGMSTDAGGGDTNIYVSVPDPGATGADIADEIRFNTRHYQRGGGGTRR